MNLIATELEGAYIVEQDVHKDIRGAFVKMFQSSFFCEHGLETGFAEQYYTRSHEDVIRGMHFQVPPKDHAKLVTVIQGTIMDVIMDIRRDSPTYGKCAAFELSRENRRSIYIPRGFAHGFCTLSDIAIAYYMVTSEYSPECDCGIRFDSINFKWPIPARDAIVSDRDRGFECFSNFKSPF